MILIHSNFPRLESSPSSSEDAASNIEAEFRQSTSHSDYPATRKKQERIESICIPEAISIWDREPEYLFVISETRLEHVSCERICIRTTVISFDEETQDGFWKSLRFSFRVGNLRSFEREFLLHCLWQMSFRIDISDIIRSGFGSLCRQYFTQRSFRLYFHEEWVTWSRRNWVFEKFILVRSTWRKLFWNTQSNQNIIE